MTGRSLVSLVLCAMLAVPNYAIRWTPEEEKALLEAVAKQGDEQGYATGYWESVAAILHKEGHQRTAKQCREKFRTHLDPNLALGKFEPFEKEIMRERIFTKEWTKIAAEINSARRARAQDKIRTPTSVRDWCKWRLHSEKRAVEKEDAEAKTDSDPEPSEISCYVTAVELKNEGISLVPDYCAEQPLVLTTLGKRAREEIYTDIDEPVTKKPFVGHDYPAELTSSNQPVVDHEQTDQRRYLKMKLSHHNGKYSMNDVCQLLTTKLFEQQVTK